MAHLEAAPHPRGIGDRRGLSVLLTRSISDVLSIADIPMTAFLGMPPPLDPGFKAVLGLVSSSTFTLL